MILEECNLPHPLCLTCDMLVTWAAMNLHHFETALCAQGAERKIRRLMEKKAQEGTVTALQAYDRPLETVTSFKYLGHLLTTNETNWPEVISNISKYRKSWSFLDWILGREGVDTRTSGRFFLLR